MLERFGVNFGQFTVPVNTRDKEVAHLIGHDVDGFRHGRFGFRANGVGPFESALFSFSLRISFGPSRLALTGG